MIITGSVLFIESGSLPAVLRGLLRFPGVTFQTKSDSGTDVVVTLEAENASSLGALCDDLKLAIPEIISINHVYVNMEDETL